MTLQVFIANNITASLTGDQKHRDLIDQSGQKPDFKTINWRDTTHFADSDDDYRIGCQNVIHCNSKVLFRTTSTRTIILNLLMKWLLGSKLSQYNNFSYFWKLEPDVPYVFFTKNV